MPPDGDLKFGAFRLDLRGHRLLRGDAAVPLQQRQFQLLRHFVEHPGEVLSKDQLIDSVWKGTAVADASLTQAVFHLRHVLDADDPGRYIETVSRVGYRFVAAVSRVRARHSDEELDALLAPHRAFLDGRAALETLEAAAIATARQTFEALVAGDPDDGTFHVGLANACVLEFEMTRTDAVPRRDALDRAARHAREACRLNVRHGEAWATLGFVLDRIGARADAAAAVRRGVALEPDAWRHHFRLSYVTWGEERLRAARRVLDLFPGCAMAHFLAATVYVARHALAEGEREIDQGLAAASDDRGGGATRFSAVALHWLKGLLCLARGDEDAALAAFERELAFEPRGHLYGREITANTWYAIGACRWRRGEGAPARAAFNEALSRVPDHPLARVGLALVGATSLPPGPGGVGQTLNGHASAPRAAVPIEVTLARAAMLSAAGDVAGAAALVGAEVAVAPPGSAGWTLAIEPLLVVARAPDVWAPVVHLVRHRAV